MLRPLGVFLMVSLVSTFVAAQITLNPVTDGSAPLNLDNRSNIIVIQPSRHPQVHLAPLVTGDNGGMAIPVMSFDGNYESTNTGLGDSFASLDAAKHLYWPNPGLPGIPSPFAFLYGPLTFGKYFPLTPTLVSGALNREMAVYFQMAIATPSSVHPAGFDITFSNGVTVVQSEGRGYELGTFAPSVPAKLGASLAAGDLNGDGIDDLAVGSPGDEVGGIYGAGRVLIFLGTPRSSTHRGGLHPIPYRLEAPDLRSLLPSGSSGPQPQAHFGSTVLIADLDGDGVGELVVAASETDGPAGLDQGAVFLYTELEPYLAPGPLTVPYTLSVSPASILSIQPSTAFPYARFGYDLVAGDLNNNGIADLAVSAPYAPSLTGIEREVGMVHLYIAPGIPGPIVRTENELLRDDVPTDFEHFGASLAMVDLDGNGSDEILIGVPGQMVGGFPGAGKIVALDYDPWGSLPVLVLPHPNPKPQSALGLSLAGGDLDGDGLGEIIAGANESFSTCQSASFIHLWRLSPGIIPRSHETLPIAAPQAFERLGRRLLVRDLNADGLDDLIVGAPGCFRQGTNLPGEVEILFGTPSAALDRQFRNLVVHADVVQTFTSYGAALACGDFAGVGVNDLVVGEPFAPSVSSPAAGRISIHTDLLHRRDNPTLAEFLTGTSPY